MVIRMATNSGWYSKFQERLKRMVRNRVKKKKKQEEEQKEFISDKVKEIRQVISNEPIRVRKFGRPRDVSRKVVLEKDIKKNTKLKILDKEDNLSNLDKDRELTLNKDVDDLEFGDDVVNFKLDNKDKDNKKTGVDSFHYFARDKNKLLAKGNVTNEEINELKIELINRLKRSFNDKLDQLDVLESELFLLNDDMDNAIEIKKVKELKEKIDKLIKEINIIIDNYNILNKNYYIDNVVDIDDKYLAQDIINYRTLLDNSNDEIDFVKGYKSLDEFKSLYERLVVIKHDTEVLIEENEDKTNKFDIRDKKYENIVKSICKIDDVQKNCLYEIEKQNDYLKELAKKINEIDRKEYVTSHLKGLDDLITQTLKYIGFRMLSPLSGLIPSIAVNTMIARNMISNIYSNLHYEDVKHVYYSAIDYNSELNSKITDIGFTYELIDNTLRDIKNLREDFMKQYDSRIPGYKDTLRKIDDIEKIIHSNQNKVNIVKKKLKDNKMINEEKICRVKKLNENS